ncbi:MAG: putative dsRNA-binding protein [Methanolinea sp.]|nr:putative dsRNA-binding protein [Methanolinea sp.]
MRIFLQQPSIGCKNPTPEALERYGNALTHPSYIQDHPRKEGASPGTEDYERLEFLGDRVLNLVVAEYLFSDGHQSEGSMTSRMEVVKNQHLGAIVPSLCIGFPEMIQLGRNQERTTRIIAASFEAFMGAYYLDGGLNATRDLIMRLMGDEISSFSPGDNYKKMLQEEVQRYPGILPVYVLREKEGPDHRPVFTYAVLLGGKVYGEGRGHSKARATQNAALAALRALGHSPPGDSESPADSL